MKRKIEIIIKRVLDIGISIVGIIILVPLTCFIWIKTDEKEREDGLFFKQDRIGKDGKKIKIYKYRSMVHNAEKILEDLLEKDEKLKEEYRINKKLKNDPRVTKIGSFLRRTSLDEFPQFINVFKGEMSFVGPRPYLFSELDDMGEVFDIIKKMKPGITGMWQVSGRSDIDFNSRLKLDVEYYKNWNLKLDILIILKTIKNVIKKEGAY